MNVESVFADSQSIKNSLQQMKHVSNKNPRPDHRLDYQNEKFRQQFNHYQYRIKNTMMMMTNFEIDFCGSSRKRFKEEFKETRIIQELSKKKNRARGERKKYSDKKLRIQESCLTAYIFLRQARFGLHESCRRTRFVDSGKKFVYKEWKKILTDNQEKQESGENDVKFDS